ncbi:hypothetical protein [Chitiniphilus eburneus]|uniref:Uncharacterized protein n=1 Tax=Chitiniphilus eburneus TaxID=2571148 RepID=A0A4U0PMD8_9NEIS|nr:hypothetical protein [Chitiniphilus eburneus]TJZ69010.1 hypothetical protein FAZ21_15185 [Chitiniphilus eburneus]
MKALRIAPLFLGLLLAACGDDSSTPPSPPPAPRISVDALPAGSYTVAIGDTDALEVGQYYTGSDGSRLLIVNDADETARTVYRQSAGGVWSAVPAPKADTTIQLQTYETRSSPLVDPAQLAGDYAVALTGGDTATFTLSATGEISPRGNGCRIAGTTGAGKLPGVLSVALTATNCAGLPASASGALFADPDYAPARLRLVMDDGTKVVDLWAYPD